MSNKIEKYGLEQDVIKWRNEGKTINAISQLIYSRGHEVSEQAIKRFLKELKNKKALIEMNDKKDIKLASSYYDISEKLNMICQRLEKALDEIDNPKDANFHKIVANIHENIKIVAKITNAIETKKEQNITINMVDLAPKINNYLIKLKEQKKLKCADCGSCNIEKVE